jgi:hypothetical protein
VADAAVPVGEFLVSLSPRVQSLVDQIVQELGMQAIRPSSIRVDLDDRGIVQRVTPELTFRLDKATQRT